ncbi:hypothetical protein SKAU_G00429230 [Synaphobranchus kaupii]|uniref:Uncharacterized protein n=1 Tax=Synaphobranchus kaupii TaxID=118154 RepID=A0A9Q1E4H4_SYNKA|nr:hypothetical protein SKAU_G00429230 [Synaphobranchus kaupii]
MPPGHTSPQGSYPLQGYSLHGHQPIPHSYPSLSQLTQAHVSGALSGPHHSGTHGPPPGDAAACPSPTAGAWLSPPTRTATPTRHPSALRLHWTPTGCAGAGPPLPAAPLPPPHRELRAPGHTDP